MGENLFWKNNRTVPALFVQHFSYSDVCQIFFEEIQTSSFHCLTLMNSVLFFNSEPQRREGDTLFPPTGLLTSVTSLCFERFSLQVVSGDELRHTHPPSYSGGSSFEVFTTDITLKTLCTHLTADSPSLTVNKKPAEHKYL